MLFCFTNARNRLCEYDVISIINLIPLFLCVSVCSFLTFSYFLSSGFFVYLKKKPFFSVFTFDSYTNCTTPLTVVHKYGFVESSW